MVSASMCNGSASVFESREARLRAAYCANRAPLLNYLRRLTRGRPESAEDLLQETMLRAWRHVDDLPSNEESVRRWLFTVARNLTIDAVRARTARPPEISRDDLNRFPAADDSLDRVLTRRTVDEALYRLPPHHRAVLFRLYYQDALVSDVATDMGIPEGTVRSRSYYALRFVRDILEKGDFEA